MTKVSAAASKEKLSYYLSRVKKGEEIFVTSHSSNLTGNCYNGRKQRAYPAGQRLTKDQWHAFEIGHLLLWATLG